MTPQLATSIALGSSEFARLPFEVQDELRVLLPAMARIHDAANKSAAILAESQRLHGHAAASPKTLERKYYAWRQRMDWRALVNRAKAPVSKQGLPKSFIEHWHSLCMQNGRNCKAAHRLLVRSWMSGEPIPGYDVSPREWRNSGLPEGWDYTNLMKGRNRPPRHALVASRIGRAAAADLRPKVLTTREGLEVGQHYMFDDMWHDFKVMAPGQSKASRIISLHALDVKSAALFAAGHKPTIWNDDEAKRENLKERDMVFFLAHVLANIGYRKAGCELHVEHGTAAIREVIEQRISDATGGAISVKRGGIVDKALVNGMFAGQGKGNFRFKAALESLHNLIHNETGDRLLFPGQTGSNARLNAPSELHGRERYAMQLLKAAANLTEDQAARIRLPMLSVGQGIDLIERAYALINGRHEHNLEGWANLTIAEWRLDPSQPWQSNDALMALQPQKREAILALVETSDALARVRLRTPAEVWQSGQRGLAKLPDHLQVQVFGPELGEERRAGEDRLIEFESDGAAYAFGPYCIDHYGERLIAPRERYRAYINPFRPDRLLLCDARGRYIGAVPAIERASRADADALRRACGRAAKIEADLMAPVIKGNRRIIEQQTADRRHNAAIIADKQPRQRKLDADQFEPLPTSDNSPATPDFHEFF